MGECLGIVNNYSLYLHAQSCLMLCDPKVCSPPVWKFSGKNIEGGCHFLLQGIFLTQGSKPRLLCLLHWQGDFFTTEPPGKLIVTVFKHYSQSFLWMNVLNPYKRGYCYSHVKNEETDTESMMLSFLSNFINLVAPGLSCGMWDLGPWSGTESLPPVLEAWSLSPRLRGKFWAWAVYSRPYSKRLNWD